MQLGRWQIGHRIERGTSNCVGVWINFSVCPKWIILNDNWLVLLFYLPTEYFKWEYKILKRFKCGHTKRPSFRLEPLPQASIRYPKKNRRKVRQWNLHSQQKVSFLLNIDDLGTNAKQSTPLERPTTIESSRSEPMAQLELSHPRNTNIVEGKKADPLQDISSSGIVVQDCRLLPRVPAKAVCRLCVDLFFPSGLYKINCQLSIAQPNGAVK